MRYDLAKYERGQVWMIRHKQTPSAVGHEQMKDRPWLVLSIGKFNNSSGMITCVPITTRDQVRSPAQVQFTNEREKNNVILCEQIKTFDHSSGAYIFDFMGQLSDEIMEKVDVALSTHLGMHYSPITLKSLYDSMEAIIKSVGYMQEKANSPKFTDKDVQEFADKLKDLVPVMVPAEQEEITPIAPVKKLNPYASPLDKFRGIPDEEEEDTSSSLVKPYYVTPADPPTRTVHTIYADDTPEETKSEKAPRMKWTPDKCREFLSDCESMPMKKVCEKWNLSKKTRYYSTKNYVQNLLTKMTQS